MPNYFLHTEPDTNNNFRLHLEQCPHIQNTKSISYLGEFDDLSTVLSECQSSENTVSLYGVDINEFLNLHSYPVTFLPKEQ